MPKELARQTFHIAVGAIAMAIFLLYGKNTLMAVSFFSMLIGFLLVNQISLGRKVGLVQWFVEKFERPNARFHGWGSACYGLGVLFLSSYLHDPSEIAASIFILAVGDSFSTIFGRNGGIKLPWNEKKTLEGTLAFAITSLPAYYFVGPLIFPVAIIAALTESVDWPIDDNLAIPIACTFFFLLV